MRRSLLTLILSATALCLHAQTDIPGCTDPGALNYNPGATVDDGSCLGVGCPDPAASNFDPFAQIFGLGDFNLCEYPEPVPGCTDPYAPNFNPLANTDDGSCEAYELAGCTDPQAFNFNPAATVDDGTCQGVGCPDPAAENFDPFAIFFGGGDSSACVYPEPILGCTNPLAPNFDPGANTDDGSCEDFVLSGCTDPLALNYNPSATDDDGSCLGLGVGCNDPAAINFNPLLIFFYGVNGFDAETAEGDSCIYPDLEPVMAGCTDPGALNFNPFADVDDGSCMYMTSGCTHPSALNYDPSAQLEDGSCIFPEDATEFVGLELDVVGEGDHGTTYQLFAAFDADQAVRLTAVFGIADTTLQIATDASFHQDPAGADLYSNLPLGAAADDSWLAVGTEGLMYAVGDGLGAFAAGGDLVFDDAVGGAWFILPDDSDAGLVGEDGRILLGQFTTEGSLDVMINLQYQAQGMIKHVAGATLNQDAPSTSTGGTDAEGCQADLDGNGAIDVNDLLMFIAQFGNACG